jgi:predicted ArsR family transcriptional regulator
MMLESLQLDSFLRVLLSYLAGTLEEVVGLEDSSGLIAVVGQQVGEDVNQFYQSSFNTERLSPSQIASALVDFKKRIDGDFYIIEQSSDKIVLGNRHCPFNHFVEGHASLCMMTSSVFGVIASQNTGYAKVELHRTIAQGDRECRVIVYLRSTEESNHAEGREYYQLP